jgi:glycosyltransferase involved in cell wall biosynthesis
MNVCILFHKYLPNEGISVSIKRLIENVPSVNFHIITGKPNSSKLDLLKTQINTRKEKNVYVHEVGFINKINSDDYLDGLDNLSFAIQKLHKKYSFDLIHSYYLTPNGYVGTIVAKKLGIPSLVSIRGNDLGKNYLDYKRIFSIYWTIKNSDFLTFVNEDLLNLANIIYPCKKKSKLILNSCFFPLKQTIQQKQVSKKLIFGYFGDIKRKKGLIYLLEAIALIKNENFKVKLLGDINDAEKEIYKNYIQKLNIENKISLSKSISREKIPNWLSKIDVCVFPVIDDGCPNVILEAIQLSKPIISTNISAVSQLLTNNKNSILVEPRDSKDLAKGMQKIIKNPKLITKYSKSAQELVYTKLNVKTECGQFVQIYKQLKKR